MNNRIVIALSGLLIFVVSTLIVLIVAYSKGDEVALEQNVVPEQYIDKINVEVDGKIYSATIENNPTAQEFAQRLPLTLNMKDLNGNEKYSYFERKFTSNPKRAGKIETGDLMLFSNDTVALFYETFSTTYSYTRIGKIDNPDDLKASVGRSDIRVIFTLMQ